LIFGRPFLIFGQIFPLLGMVSEALVHIMSKCPEVLKRAFFEQPGFVLQNYPNCLITVESEFPQFFLSNKCAHFQVDFDEPRILDDFRLVL
jgi:hypothetical protein